MTTTSQPPLSSTNTHHHHHRQLDDDGGWSRGSPAKGSGWSSKRLSHGLPTRDGIKSNDWRGSPEVDGAAIWPVAEHRHQGSSGSGEVDSWNTFSPGQSSRQHSQPENWMSDEGSLSVGENTCSPHSNSSPSPSTVNWHVGSDPTPNVQHELEPIEDDELVDREEIRDGRGEGESRTPRLQLGHLHQHTPDREDSGEKTNSSDPVTSGWDSFRPTMATLPTTDSDQNPLEPPLAPSSSSSPSPCCSDSQQQFLRGSPGRKNMSCSPSRDLDKNLEVGANSSSPDPCSLPSSEILRQQQQQQHEDFPGARSRDLVTPDGSGGGGGLGMSVWKCRPSVGGSTSSINSVGSNSSWKSDGKNGYHSKTSSNYSPRKTTRYCTYTCINPAPHFWCTCHSS